MCTQTKDKDKDADPSLPLCDQLPQVLLPHTPLHLTSLNPSTSSGPLSYHCDSTCHSSPQTFAPNSSLFASEPGTSHSLSLRSCLSEASDMCTGKCARCLGLSLIPLSLVCIVANALLLVPDGKTTWTDGNLSLQVWLMGGFIGGGLMVRMPEHWPGAWFPS